MPVSLFILSQFKYHAQTEFRIDSLRQTTRHTRKNQDGEHGRVSQNNSEGLCVSNTLRTLCRIIVLFENIQIELQVLNVNNFG